jgi:hypothetical protein
LVANNRAALLAALAPPLIARVRLHVVELHSPSRSQVPVKYQVEFNVIISIVFVAIFAFIICMSGREYLDMRRGIVPKIVFD